MCKFFSGIQTKNGVLFDFWEDHHESIIKAHKLDDKTRGPDFVRLELIPKAEPWNHDPKNWELVVDQDTRPSWFNEEFARRDMWEALQKLWAEVLIQDQKLEEIKDRRIRWMVNSEIKQMRGTSQVGVMRGTSQVGEMWETSQVGEMWETSQVGVMRGTSKVGVMRGTSQVGVMWETSKVGVMEDLATAIDRRGDKPFLVTPDKTMKIKIFKVVKS